MLTRKQMKTCELAAISAAVLTPRHPDGSIDAPTLKKHIRFLMEKGISSFALNGATGEFCLTTPAQLKAMLSAVNEASEGSTDILCGIGAAGSALSIELASLAQQEGAKALLLPVPYFFPYQQADIELFSRTVAQSTTLPVLLYNLPQFTSGLDVATVRRLIAEVPNIVGIKDSSGSLDILRDLTEHGVEACRIIGNDSCLAPALLEGVCDGVISGVACALPELILELYSQKESTDSIAFQRAGQLLSEFIEQVDQFPTPWGLKWIVEARGIIPATFAQPVTEQRIAQSREMIRWFQKWSLAVVPAKTASL